MMMTRGGKSNQNLAVTGKKDKENQSEAAVRVKLITEIGDTLRFLIKWGALVLIAYFGIYKPATVLSGKQTTAKIDYFYSLLGDLRTALSVSVVFGVGGMYYGFKQKKRADDVTKKLEALLNAQFGD